MKFIKSGLVLVLVKLFLAQIVVSVRGSVSRRSFAASEDDCPPWFQFNASINRCVCSTEGQPRVKCTDGGALLKIGSCMTFDEGSNITSLGRCSYFQLDPTQHNITEQRFISLPSHLSDLNDYVCGPMNRQGLICSECIEGFAPSLTSIGYHCSECTNAWYGVPLYLFLELVPVTILYFIMLFFRISLTSAPMTSFVLFSQLAVYSVTGVDSHMRNVVKLVSPTAYKTLASLITFYSIFNLDFFRYVIPPFCVSPTLKSRHVAVLEYLSAYYPLFLILITYFIVKVNVCKWKSRALMQIKMFRYIFQSQWILNIESSLIGVFASYLLLSYTKFMFAFTTFLGYVLIFQVDGSFHKRHLGVDPSVTYFSGVHLPFFLFGTLSMLFTVVLSAFLLTFYPIRVFRSLLLHCCCGGRLKAAFNIFVEKFHSCYRDGLDGGRDMRSLCRILLSGSSCSLSNSWVITPSHVWNINMACDVHYL